MNETEPTSPRIDKLSKITGSRKKMARDPPKAPAPKMNSYGHSQADPSIKQRNKILESGLTFLCR